MPTTNQLHLSAQDIRARVLARFPGLAEAEVEPFGSGLINQTFRVRRGRDQFVLQRLNPIFPPAINGNIAAVTQRLATQGLPTPRLVPTEAGELWVDLGEDGGSWRMLTYVDGVAFNTVVSPAQARAAGRLVARFHCALDGLSHQFVGMRAGVHDTGQHLARLHNALETCRTHRLFAQVSELAAGLLAAAAQLPSLPELPARICHGDLKLNNILFAGAEAPAAERAVCLIDLDTVGPMPLAYELGDAWRSWCNRRPEDAQEAQVDLQVFEASCEGYQDGLGRDLSADERRALLHGVEWISLELSARFAADALLESYFGWDSTRYATRGDHNLARARGQWALHQAFCAERDARARVLTL